MIKNPYEEQIAQAARKWGIDPRLLTWQVCQESQFKADAVSDCGAIGLLQLLPTTARELGVAVEDLYVADKNLQAGARYLRLQYNHFPEIHLVSERWKFALAAYNCGRGYINKALEINRGARRRFPLVWDLVKCYLMHPACLISSRRPDAVQVIDYVYRIWRAYEAELKRPPEDFPAA
jgi:membrane-bound lytic murein transglycosylase F